MPRTIKADGKTIVVPDDATDDEINQLVGPAPTSSLKTEPKQGFISSGLDSSGLTGLGGMAKEAILHPLTTGKNIAGAFGIGAENQDDNPILKGIGNMVRGSVNAIDKATKPVPGRSFADTQRDITSAVPFFGSSIAKGGDQIDKGNIAGGLGTAVGILGSIFAPEVVPRVASKIPTRAGAGKLFEKAMSAAQNEPVSLTNTMPEMTRMQELADRGGSMPTAAGKLLGRIPSTSTAPMTYREARDFASNLSGLSSGERQLLTPVVKSQAGKLSSAFNSDVAGAADRAGVLPEYSDAMKQYAQAMKIRKTLINGAKIAAPAALGYGVLHKFLQPLIPER